MRDKRQCHWGQGRFFGINGSGELAMLAGMKGPGITGSEHAMCTTHDGIHVIAATGWLAPGAGGKRFSSFYDYPMDINDAGQVVFSGKLNAVNLYGTWSTDVDGTLKMIADFSFEELAISAGGTIAAKTKYGGIWSGDADGLTEILGPGDRAPGTDEGVTFDTFREVVLNAAGQIAFQGSLEGPGVTDANDEGIWAQDLDGNLNLIVREGDALASGPGVFQTVEELGFRGISGNQDGRGSGMNDFGQLAFVAKFTDGSNGVFLSNAVAVPEPATWFLALVGGVCLVIPAALRRLRRLGVGCCGVFRGETNNQT